MAEIIKSEFAARERVRLARRVLTDPYWLATEVLGYDKLREDVHKPLMEEMWLQDRWYFQWLKYGRVQDSEGGGAFRRSYLLMMKRGGYKTTMAMVRVIANLFRDPRHSFFWWHAVEERAIESATEIGRLLQTCESLRKLMDPVWRPPTLPRARKWNAGGKWDLACGGKEQTFRSTGQTSEATGGHCRTGVGDDIIGRRTIEDGAMPKVRSWLADSMSNIVDPDGRKWFQATHWSEDDVYVDMRRSRDFLVHVMPSKDSEGNCIPHRAGQTVAQANRERKELERSPGMTTFIVSCQQDNDPLPDEARRWKSSFEQSCDRVFAMQGAGKVFVLSDPAPMGLGAKGEKDKERGEAGKDFWSVCVVRLRWRGDYQDVILLDGSHSQEWTDADGYDEVCRLMGKWRTTYFFDEDYSGGQLFSAFQQAAQRNGVRYYTEPDTKKRVRLPQYSESYVADAKKRRMQKMCDRGSSGEVWVCETVPAEFREGDGHKTGVLTQARKWIPLVKGRSNLHYDDDWDVFARATDKRLQELMPSRPVRQDEMGELAIWALEEPVEDEEIVQRSRYCGV